MNRNLFAGLFAFTLLTVTHWFMPTDIFRLVVAAFFAAFFALLMTPEILDETPLMYLVYPVLIMVIAIICTSFVLLLAMLVMYLLGHHAPEALARYCGFAFAAIVGLGTYKMSRSISNEAATTEMPIE